MKKNFRNQEDVAFTPQFFSKKFVLATSPSVDCTEKVQSWKLFYKEKLYLE